MQEIYWLILGVLCTWRLTHLLQAEDGPWDLLSRLREALGSGFVGKLVACFYCLSLWIAAPIAWFLGSQVGHKLLLWLALSAGAILIERVTNREEFAPAPYLEGDMEHELLRTRIENLERQR